MQVRHRLWIPILYIEQYFISDEKLPSVFGDIREASVMPWIQDNTVKGKFCRKRTEDEDAAPTPPNEKASDSCSLTPELGFEGTQKFIEECDGLGESFYCMILFATDRYICREIQKSSETCVRAAQQIYHPEGLLPRAPP